LRNFVLIHTRESQREVIFRISVEVTTVMCDVLP
jgi:hypothetical protein